MKMDLALKNLQRLICNKTQETNKPTISRYIFKKKTFIFIQQERIFLFCYASLSISPFYYLLTFNL